MISSLLLLCVIGWAIFSRIEDPLAHFKGGASKKSPEEHASYVVNYMRTNGLTLEQLTSAWSSIPHTAQALPAKQGANDIAAKVMFYLGAVFVFAGIGVYTSMFWESMSSFMRIFVTLGVGMGLSVLSVVAMKEKKYPGAMLPLIVVAALVQCGGWFVFLQEMFPQGDDFRKAAIFCFGMMAFQQGMVFHAFRRDSLAITAIAFAYGALQAALDLAGMKDEHIALLLGGSLLFTTHILERTPHRALCTVLYLFSGLWFNTGIYVVMEWQTDAKIAAMITGVTISSLGYAMRLVGQDKLAGLGLFFGSALFYAGLFDEVRHTPVELLYFAMAIAMMYISALLHSRALLATSVLAILGFIGYYTSEHFLNSAGWPIALMLMGVAFLGVGTMAVRIKRRYNL